VALLQARGLPVPDFTGKHLEHFFFVGSDGSPTGLAGLELYGADALLHSLVVADNARGEGLGSTLIDHAHTLGSIPVYREDTAVFDHGASSVRAESSTVQCCVPAQKARPMAACCAK
jgi:GNAT superfamily N-acetyltransferase